MVFIAAFLFLNTMVNLRYPGSEPTLWYVVPSVEVLIVLAYFAWFRSAGWRVPKGVHVALVAGLLAIRLLRAGDGVQERYFAQKFNLYTDLPLVPELVRFLRSSLPIWGFVLIVLAVLAGLVALCLSSYYALVYSEQYLQRKRHVYTAAVVAGGLFVGAWGLGHHPRHDALFSLNGLGASVLPRVEQEVAILFNLYSERAGYGQRITQSQERYRSMPTNLAKLKRADVHLILIESYGQCVLEVPEYVDYMRPVFDDFEKALAESGFTAVTGFLKSSTYGGQSWFAHATLGTGIRITNQLEHEIVVARRPKTLASFFRAAGYRTVLVAPATSRPWPKGEFYNFEHKYYGWHFGYEGPSFAWAPMPDQFVLDFVRRKELTRKEGRPSFIQYLLVSSHAPWSDIPPVIEDWSRVGDGSIYRREKRHRYPVKWPHFEHAQRPYVHSIAYDFRILTRYIPEYVQDPALVVVLGDHQPVWDVNGYSDAWGVPVHVMSRDPALLEPFRALGYAPGIRKTPRGNHAGLETFLPDFLTGFSTGTTQSTEALSDDVETGI